MRGRKRSGTKASRSWCGGDVSRTTGCESRRASLARKSKAGECVRASPLASWSDSTSVVCKLSKPALSFWKPV
jgi:hypothetical protein